MAQSVTISFECLPLRAISRFDVPLDAPPDYEALANRIRRAVETHGLHNSYYLHRASCDFHLTNDPSVGLLSFRFEGVVLTDPCDRNTLHCHLDVDLVAETCDWLTEPVVKWFSETVRRAVQSEFDQFIRSGDLERTVQRMLRLQQDCDSHGGFLGMWL
jgi:hypothetical protein